MRIFLILGGVASAAVLGFVAGQYWEGRSAEPEGSTGELLATYEGGAVYAGDVRALIDRSGPAAREQARTAEGAKALVEDALRQELMASAARSAGYHLEPAVRADLEEVLVRHYRERQIEQPAEQGLTDADLRAAFEQERPRLAIPERVRLSVILVRATEANRPARLAEAKRVLAEARRALDKSPDGFADVARAKSEDSHTQPIGGQLPFLSREELAQRFGAPVADAAFALTDVGGMADAPVETGDGFAVIRLMGRQPAQEPTLEQLAPRLRTALIAQRTRSRLDQEVQALRERFEARIDDAAVTRFAQTFAGSARTP